MKTRPVGILRENFRENFEFFFGDFNDDMFVCVIPPGGDLIDLIPPGTCCEFMFNLNLMLDLL